MLNKRTYKIHKTRVNPMLSIAIALLVALSGVIVWKNLPKNSNQASVEIVPGEFPKKVEEVNGEVVEEKKTEEAKTEVAVSVYPIQLTSDEANSITVVVNKKHKLQSDFTPTLSSARGGQMHPEAGNKLELLFVAAESNNLSPVVISSYRSYSKQEQVYGGYVQSNGQAQADTFSARPGHSEHQTGLAVDVGNSGGNCDLEICFGTTALGEWLKTNAHLYGFIVRYPEGKDGVTGYQYEPWHLRYVGVSTALAIYNSGKTMDEYFGVVAGSY